MPQSNQFDAPESLLNVALPYDKQKKELDTEPRFVDGENGFVDLGGRFRKRPALRKADFASLQPPANHRLVRLWLYETLENPQKVFILASAFDTINSDYTMYYLRLDAGAPAWTEMGAVRGLRTSDHPHEVVVANGQAYIKAFNINGSETLGTVRFDGTDESTNFWGALGPTDGATLTSSAGWDASDNSTTINFGWQYSYSFELASGHITNRAPLDVPTGVGVASPSDTGAFTDKVPAFTYTGDADTTQFPKVIIWRTTDGGGPLVRLDRINNPGSGSQTYEDDKRIAVPVTNGDPKTDFQLDTQDIAPSLTSNSPPPSVIYPEVVGTDTIKRTTQMAEFASRIFYGIENVLVFSGFEEIINGVPFESFPSGLRGNFVRLKNTLRNAVSTSEALYILTHNNVLWLRGTDRTSFQIRPLFQGVGAQEGMPAGATALREAVAWLTHDNQIALARGTELEILSGPLGSDLSALRAATHDVQLTGHFFEGNAWLVVCVRDLNTPADSRVYVYDIVRGQWNVPWKIPVTAVVSGRIRETDGTPQLVFATDDGTTRAIVVADLDSAEDQHAASDAGFAWNGTTNTFVVPAGNHVNQLRRQGISPTLSFIKFEHTGSADPTVEYRLNEVSGALTSATLHDPPYHAAPTTYTEKWAPIQKAASRAALKISKSADTTTQALQTVAFLWQTTTPPSP